MMSNNKTQVRNFYNSLKALGCKEVGRNGDKILTWKNNKGDEYDFCFGVDFEYSIWEASRDGRHWKAGASIYEDEDEEWLEFVKENIVL